MLPDPVLIATLAWMPGENKKLPGPEARDGHICLNSTALIQKLRVNGFADRDRQIRTTDSAQSFLRVRSLNEDFSVHRLVENDGAFLRRAALLFDIR